MHTHLKFQAAALAAFALIAVQGVSNGQCSAGSGTSTCGTDPIIKFNGFVYAEVGNEGTVSGTLQLGPETASSADPPEAGLYYVSMPDPAAYADAEAFKQIETKPEEVIYGVLTGNPSVAGTNYTSSGWMFGFFFPENDCGLDLEISERTGTNPDTWSEWEKKKSITDWLPAELSSKSLHFKVRFHKKAKTPGDGASPDNGDGSDTAGNQGAGSYPPTIPDEQQDVPPAAPGGFPIQMSPAGFQTDLSLGATKTSEGYNTGTLWFSGPISPGLADVSKLKVTDPDETALSVIQDGANLRQVSNGERLADIQTVSGGGFNVKFYESGSFGTTLSGGLYPITGSPSVIVNYAPVAADSPNHLGGVRVTTTGPNGIPRQQDVLSTSGDGTSWREVMDGGAVVRDTTCAFLYESSHWKRVDLQTVIRNGVLVSKTEKTHLYQYRRAGSPAVMVENHMFRLEEKVYDSAGTFRTSSWEPSATLNGQVNSVIRPDGSWEAYTYYDGTESGADPSWRGLLKETLSPWNGSPASPSAASTTNSQVTLVTYGLPESGGGLTAQTRVTTIPGCASPVRRWERSAGGPGVSGLAYALQLAGVDAAWLPYSSDIEAETSINKASASEGLATSSYTYNGSHVPESAWIGSSFASLDEEGNGSVTGYERGTYNAGSGTFTVNDPSDNSNWNSDYRSTTVKLMNQSIPNDFEGTKEIVIRDWRGKPLRSELHVLTDSGTWPFTWDLASVTTYEYPALWADGTPKEIIVKHDGRIVSDSIADSATQNTSIDEQGIKTITVTDALGRNSSVTKEGIGSQPDITTTYTYSGSTTTVTTSSAGLVRSTSSTVDLSGRSVSVTDAAGAVTSTSYPNGGRDTLTTLPGGLIRLVSRNIDGKTVSVTGSAVVDETWEYAVDANGNLLTTRRVGDLANSPRFTTTLEDWAGRTLSVTSPSPTGSGTVATTTAYLTGTRAVTSVSSPNGVMLHSRPDPWSSRTLSGLDLGADGSLDDASTDRVSDSMTQFVQANGYWWEQRTTKTYDQSGSAASAVTSISRTCLHGNPAGNASWSVNTLPTGGTVETKTTIDRANKTLTTTVIQSGVATNAVSVNVNGLLVSSSGHEGAVATTWNYDALGRPVREISPRGAVTHKAYYADGSLGTSTDHTGKTTTYAYYPADNAAAGKLMTVTNPSGKTTTYTYNSLGQVTEEGGTAVYKVTYDYDSYGAKNKMWTWRDATTSDLSEWIYQSGTGLLLEKKDAAGKSTTYTYAASGKPATRTWARGVTTTYSYNAVTGDLTGIDYSDATPDVTLGGYDRLGRPSTITQTGIGTETLTYHPGQAASFARFYDAAHTLLPGKGIRSSLPDSLGRPTGFVETTSANSSVVRTVGYSYNATTGLFEKITDGSQNHTYAYHPNSKLVSTILSNSGATAWFRESRYYDTGSRLLGIRSDRMSGNSVTAPISVNAYDYDELGRRVKQTFQDGSYWQYGYNDRSEVTAATRKTSGSVEITPLNAAYSYDGIGNRLTSTSPVLGDHTYTPNGLNQYASISSTNTRTAVGRAPAAWNVQVAGVNASRIGEVFYRPLTASNSTAPVWQNLVIQRDTGSPTTTQHLWYPAQSFTPVHDFDGNLTSDGRWIYTWDAENRLVQMESTTQATAAGHPYTKLKFAYDWQGRRIARHVWQGGTQAAPTYKKTNRWLYDGWNPVTEFSSTTTNPTPLLRTGVLTWGLDLSGTLQGAGGVGGLLMQSDGAVANIERASYDGNGNIVSWTRNDASAPSCRREYDAFGNTLVSEGIQSITISTFGFSTKMQDVETGLYYYGYRFYDPATGRWPSRDPIGENGGANLNRFVNNNTLNWIELLGLVPEMFEGEAEFVNGQPSYGATATTSQDYPKQVIAELDDHEKGCKIRTHGSLKILITFKGSIEEYNATRDAVAGDDGKFGFLKDHEQVHVEDIKKHWNEFVSDVQWLRGAGPDDYYDAGCHNKAVLAHNYYITRFALYELRSLKAGCELDKAHYIDNLAYRSDFKHKSYIEQYHASCDDIDTRLLKAQNLYDKSKKEMDEYKCP